MSLEEVKCFGSPRTSQMPRSGSCQCSIAVLDLALEDRPHAARAGSRATWCAGRPSPAPRPRRRAGPGRRRRCRPAPAGRARSPTRWSSVCSSRSARPSMPYMICSWPFGLLGAVGDEVEEVVGLPVEAERVQPPQRERRVADPAVAVVPVALALRRLGQRGRRGGDERAAGRVGQALERQRRALQVGPPRVVGELAAVEPVLPVVGGPDQPVVGVVDVRGAGVLGPGQRAEERLALLHHVPRGRARALEAEVEVA